MGDRELPRDAARADAPGQPVDIHVDALDLDLTGKVESIGGATGSRFSVLPPENASGNYVKVVQRIPVRIRLDPGQAGHRSPAARDVGRAEGARDVRERAPARRRPRPPARPAYFATGWTGGHNPWAIALVVTMATFMEVLDTSIANVSLPHIAGNLSVSQDESTWVLTSYLVSNAIVLPISGWLATKVGRKRFYMTCVALFTISSFLCGIAPSLGWLIFFRVLQGIGGGGLGPSEQSILADTFPPAKRGMAFAVYGMAVVLAPAIGPTLGGFITDHFSWRWVFFINVPVGIVSLFLSNRLVTDPPHIAAGKAKTGGIDFIGLGAHRASASAPRDRARQGAGGRLVRLAVHRRMSVVAGGDAGLLRRSGSCSRSTRSSTSGSSRTGTSRSPT